MRIYLMRFSCALIVLGIIAGVSIVSTGGSANAMSNTSDGVLFSFVDSNLPTNTNLVPALTYENYFDAYGKALTGITTAVYTYEFSDGAHFNYYTLFDVLFDSKQPKKTDTLEIHFGSTLAPGGPVIGTCYTRKSDASPWIETNNIENLLEASFQSVTLSGSQLLPSKKQTRLLLLIPSIVSDYERISMPTYVITYSREPIHITISLWGIMLIGIILTIGVHFIYKYHKKVSR